jgi:adenosylmethionine-8-amino-7-oxononanoate aminotransferase
MKYSGQWNTQARAFAITCNGCYHGNKQAAHTQTSTQTHKSKQTKANKQKQTNKSKQTKANKQKQTNKSKQTKANKQKQRQTCY